jgi:phosphatidylglycerol:prolipoprotein diacylglycerol transferase
MTFLGMLCAGIYACVISKRNNIDYVETILFLLVSCIGIVLGSHILYIIVNYKRIESLKAVAGLFLSGSIFYGGLIGGSLIVYIFRNKFCHFDKIIEIVTPSIPLFHFFGRIGCFLYGCCFGIENAIGFQFRTSPIEIANGVKRVPIQLIEAVFNLILFIFLHKLQKSRSVSNSIVRKPGELSHKPGIFYIYLITYSIGRFTIEFFRGDTYRGIWFFNLSSSQLISIIIFLCAFYFIARKKIRSNKYTFYNQSENGHNSTIFTRR